MPTKITYTCPKCGATKTVEYSDINYCHECDTIMIGTSETTSTKPKKE